MSPAQYTGTLQSNTKMADVDDRGSAGDEEGGKDLWYEIKSDRAWTLSVIPL